MRIVNDAAVEYRQLEGFPWYRFGSDGTAWSRLVRSSRGRGNGGWCWRATTDFHKLKTNKKVYTVLTLKSDTGEKVVSLHVVIATLFSGPKPFPEAVARHWDGDLTNNRASNILWGTVADNAADAIRHGRLSRGSNNHFSKLNETNVETIRVLIRNGQSNPSIATLFGVTPAAISQIRRGVNWSHLGEWDGNKFKVRSSTPKMLTWNGRTQRLCEWARELKMQPLAILRRIRSGWSIDRAFTEPIDPSKRNRNAKVRQ